MLALILATAVASQVYQEDFYFMQAQENFVIDNIPKPKGYAKYIPKDLLEQVELFDDDCARCRKRANEAVIAMGPDAIRWLFWPLRSTNLRISMHAEALLKGLSKCRFCKGEGECLEFVPTEGFPQSCAICNYHKLSHFYNPRKCVHCIDGMFEVHPDPYFSWREIPE